MEFADGGDLSTHTGSFQNNFPAIQAVLAQLVAALKVLHSKEIFHGDLKLENVLLSRSEGMIKLADFGLSSKVQSGSEIKASRGTPDYMAPEQLRSSKKGLASDCWSLGICAWELATGMPPFYAPDPDQILSSVAGADWTRDLADRAPGPEAFKSLLCGLLQADPKKRLQIQGKRKSRMHVIVIKSFRCTATRLLFASQLETSDWTR